jgi:hypothetical protein
MNEGNMNQVVERTPGGIDVEALQARERIAVATAAAMFVAGVLLMTTVLPAEYGVDPLGTGRLLGLTRIAGAGAAAATTAGGPTSLEPIRPEANTAHAAPFKRDTRSFQLGPFEAVEYKYRMEKGGNMVYAWRSTGRVKAEFHGEPQGAPKGYAEFYEKRESDVSANGSFFAPTSGIHGWYWENLSADPVTITLNSAGFFTNGIEFTKDGRTEHPIPD